METPTTKVTILVPRKDLECYSSDFIIVNGVDISGYLDSKEKMEVFYYIDRLVEFANLTKKDPK